MKKFQGKSKLENRLRIERRGIERRLRFERRKEMDRIKGK